MGTRRRCGSDLKTVITNRKLDKHSIDWLQLPRCRNSGENSVLLLRWRRRRSPNMTLDVEVNGQKGGPQLKESDRNTQRQVRLQIGALISVVRKMQCQHKVAGYLESQRSPASSDDWTPDRYLMETKDLKLKNSIHAYGGRIGPQLPLWFRVGT
jgi:hypothetical protein